MNTLQQLQDKEKRLSDRKQRLHGSIVTLKNNLNEGNIESSAEEIHKLEVQLELTETALKNAQNQLTEEKNKLASKEYKDKQEMQEKLSRQAQEQTVKVFKKLVELEEQAGKALSTIKQADKVFREIETDKVKLAYSLPSYKQPFSWLAGLLRKLNGELKLAEYIQDKLQ